MLLCLRAMCLFLGLALLSRGATAKVIQAGVSDAADVSFAFPDTGNSSSITSFLQSTRKSRPRQIHASAKRNLAVCITGQILRLELRSKIDNIVKPAMEAGMNVRVALVVDPRDKPVYIHHNKKEHFNRTWSVGDGPFKKLEETAGLFPHDASVIFDEFVPQDLQIDKDYQKQVSRTADGTYNYTQEHAAKRVLSHVRQWQNLHRCWEVLNQPGFTMDYLLRLRDDAYITTPYVPSGTSPAFISLQCDAFNGINDKFAVAVGADVAERYLTSSLELMQHNYSKVLAFHRSRTNASMNPESVLLSVASLNNFTMTKIGTEHLNFAAIRYVYDGRQRYNCIFFDHKDCFSDEAWDALRQRGTYLSAGAHPDPAHQALCERAL